MKAEQSKCATVIPSSWPTLVNPASTGHVNADRTLWYNHLRTLNLVGPTPKVYRGKGE